MAGRVTPRAPKLVRGAGVLTAFTGLALIGHPGISAPGKPAPKRDGKSAVATKKPAPQPGPGVALPAPGSRAASTAREALPAIPPPGNQIMKVSEVRAGMKGYGLTVFRGTAIERFEVDIVGVLPKSYMGQSLILVKLSGGPISERGAFLIQGMSGSPIYVNGKLLGAFSMGDAWPKEPLGMVTPIEDMMEALDPKLSQVPAGEIADASGSLPDFAQGGVVTGAAAASGDGLFRAPEFSPVTTLGQSFRPLALPVSVSGLSGRRLERVAQALQPFNLNVMAGPGSSDVPFKAELTPGAAVGVALMTGDVDMTSIGTITYRSGNDVLAFGHPMMQLGAAQFPMTTAWIHDVFSGFQVSHKIGSAGELVGTLTQDRPFSVAGRVGPLPKMIPVKYSVSDKTTGRSRTFNVQVANHPLLVGQLLPVAVNQGLFTVRPVPGDAVARVRMKVETEGAGTITRDNVFFDPAAIDVAAVRELQEVMMLLANNNFRRVPVKSLEMQVEMEDRRPTATIERIFLSQEKFEPGEEVEVGVVLRPYRKDPILLKSKIHVPKGAANGRGMVMVQGGATRVNLSALMSGGGGSGMPMPGASSPDPSLGGMLKKFSERERNDQLVVRLVFPTSAVNVDGEKLSRLPSTLVDVMRSSKTTGFRIERDDAKTTQDTDYIVQGLQVLPITLEKEDHLEKPKPGMPSTGSAPGSSLPGPSGPASGVTRLGAGDDFDDLATTRGEVVRFTVDGQVRTFRLTSPEDEEKEEKRDRKRSGDKSDKKDSAKDDKKDGKSSRAADEKTGKEEPEAKAGVPSSTPPAAAAPAPAPDSTLVSRPVKVWTQTAQGDFERGDGRSIAVGTAGEIRLAPTLKLAYESPEQFVWSVASVNGSTYAGTGNGGLVVKVDGEGKGSVFFRTGDLEVHALARDAAGNLYAGTGPNGKIFRIGADGKGTEILALNPQGAASETGGKYVLALVAAADGTLYAGTGPEGKVLRIRSAGGTPQVQEIASLGEMSVLSLAVAADGTVYAGTAEDGAVYRIPAAGGARVLYDSDQAAITGLALDQQGQLFAAAAPSGQIYKIGPDGAANVHYGKSRSAVYGLLIDRDGVLYTAGGDSILRIEKDGSANILSDPKRAQFTCVAWAEDGSLVAGSANVGSVYRTVKAASGSFESTVHDAKQPARWGRIRYTAEAPQGGSITIQTRSGNTAEPDASWSAWQDPISNDKGTFVASPVARFLQYRAVLQAPDGAPALREISVSYLPKNQAPKLVLAAPAGGEIWKGTQSLKWAAQDPDGDTLTYVLSYSADGGRTWKPVGEAPGSASAASSSGSQSRPTRANAEAALKQYQEQLEKDSSVTPQQREEALSKARQMVDQYFKENPESAGGDAGAKKPEEAAKPDAAKPDGPKPGAAKADEKKPEGDKPAAAKTPGVTRQTSLNWDTKQVPDGIYLLRVVATDKASNPSEPLLDVKLSEPFIVANTGPQLFLFEAGASVAADGQAMLSGFSTGRVALKGAQYRVNGGEWMAVDAEDGIWDSAFEAFRLPVEGTGTRNVEVKVVDVAGNAQVSKAEVKSGK